MSHRQRGALPDSGRPASHLEAIYAAPCRACKATGSIPGLYLPIAVCGQCRGAGTALYKGGSYWPPSPRPEDDSAPDARYDQSGGVGEGGAAGRAQ